MKGLARGRRTVTTIRVKDKIRAKDLLNRKFFTVAPDKVWITNFTDVPTGAGFTYVSFMIDLFSRRILSWATSTSHDTEFVKEALRMALWQRRHGSGSRKARFKARYITAMPAVNIPRSGTPGRWPLKGWSHRSAPSGMRSSTRPPKR